MRISEITNEGNFLRLVELFPPGLPRPDLMRDSQKFDLSLRFEKLVESVNAIGIYADAFCLPELRDGERIHMNSVGVASELKRKTGSEVVPTLTLRDANRQNILGTIAYAIYADIENILVVRGDPYKEGDKSAPKNVYDFQKISSIVTLIRKLEAHLADRNALCILSPVNLAKLEESKYLQTIKDREEAGIDIFVAESMFEDVETCLDRVRDARSFGIDSPIIHSIFPLRSYEDALYCIQKFGWKISHAELRELKTRGEEYGLEMARTRYQGLLRRRGLIQGASISTRGNSEIVRLISV